jgi:hypothetical protein
MDWCRGGVVEGNHVYNADIGGPFCDGGTQYQDSRSIKDLIVRNNFYKNVARGPWWQLGGLAGAATAGFYERSGNTLTCDSLTAANMSGWAVGDRVRIDFDTAGSVYDGTYVIQSLGSAEITVTTPNTSGPLGGSLSAVQKVFGIGRAIVEGNVVELAPGVADFRAILVEDHNSGAWPGAPDFTHGDIIIRNNKIRYNDGVPPPATTDPLIEVQGAKHLHVTNNIVDSGNAQALQNLRCGAATYFNNQTPAGVLIQGYDSGLGIKYSELATEAEDAFVLAFLEK